MVEHSPKILASEEKSTKKATIAVSKWLAMLISKTMIKHLGAKQIEPQVQTRVALFTSFV